MSNSIRSIGVVAALVFAMSANAAPIDLRTDGASTTINTAVYQAFDSSGSVGTGNFPGIVKIGSNNSITQGYNTNGAAALDAGNSPLFTFLLSTMNTVTIGSTQYVQFVLDINEPGNRANQDISLDNVQIFTSTSDTLGGYSDCLLGGATCIYNMDQGANNSVLLTAALNSGSGNGFDMTLNIPVATFAGLDAFTNYVYIYSKFGEQTGFGNNGGFEEWAYNRCPTGTTCWDQPVNVPVPGSVALLGLGLLALGLSKKRKS
jgi:PEP-CTERM motif